MRIATALIVLMLVASGSMVALAAEGQPISAGKTYTFDVKVPLKKYPDPDGKKLTDGVISNTTSYLNPAWVGFWSTEPFVVTIDLETSQPIHQVRTYNLSGAAGITWPTQLFLLVSKDRVEWSEPVEMAIDDVNPDKATAKWFTMDNLDLEGRYVQVAYFPPFEGRNIFISEIEVY